VESDSASKSAAASPKSGVLAALTVTVFQPQDSTLAVEDILAVLELLGAAEPDIATNSDLSTDNLVITTGSAVTAAQRQQIRQAFEAKGFSVTVRGVVGLDEDVRVILPI